MKILVTGGAGFIGTKLIPSLLNAGHDITVLDTLRFGGDSLLSWFSYPNFHFVKGDVRDEKILSELINKTDYIVHLAALVGFPICDKLPHEAMSINLDASKLINKVRGTCPIFFSSTDSNYGATKEQFVTEEVPLNPKSLYGRTKTESEKIFLDHGNATVFRFSSAFGVSTRMRLDNLVHDFVYQAKNNKALLLYEAGAKRSFVHVSDMARAIQFAVETSDKTLNKIFNIAHPEARLTKLELAEIIREFIPFYLHVANHNKDAEQRNFILDSSRLTKLGFKYEKTLNSGLIEVVNAMAAIEIKSNYYPN